MDEPQPPSLKKHKSAASDLLPSQGRRLARKATIAEDLAESCATPSESPPKSLLNYSSITSSSHVPSGKNTKADSSIKPNAASQCHVSSRVSRPTFKKASVFKRRSRSSESDGTPPCSITLPTAPPPSLKRKKPMSSPIKRLAGNSTPSKSKWLDSNPIELTSSDDGQRAQPPQKRVKRTHKKPLSSEVIDLCSESEGITSSPRRTRTRGEGSVVVVLSTDEESDLEIHSFCRSAFRDVSSLIEDETVFRASPSPQARNTPVAEEDGVMDENNIHAEKVDLPPGSLQALYDEALARCAREPQHAKDIADQPSSFSSLKCLLPARIIRYATQSQSPTLHTPLFFGRIIYRLRARLRQLKTVNTFLDANTFLEAFSADTNLNSMEASNLNKEQEDTQTYSDTVMESLTVDGKAPEVATKIILMPPLDFQDDVLSDTQAALISPNILVNNLNVIERPVSKVESSSRSANQENSLPLESTMLEDTPVPDSNKAQEISSNRRTATPDRANSSAISPYMLCDTPSNQSNLDAVSYQIETPREAEISLFRRENCTDQVPVIKPNVLKDAKFLVQALQKRYDASKISEFLLLPALELNDATKPPTTFESLSESMPHTTIKNASSVAISNSEDTAFKCLFGSSIILPDHAAMQDIFPQCTEDTSSTSESSETPMIVLTEQATTLNLSSPAGPSTEDASPGSKCLSETPAIPNLSSLTSSSSADTLTSCNSSPSTRSCQSLDSSASAESVTSPSPITPLVNPQKQEPFICSNPLSSPVDVSFFDIDMSELNLQMLIGNKFDDDDDISVSGMELAYPEDVS